MDKFAQLSTEDRKDILGEAAKRMDLSEIIIEKDFWVCWTLKRLFQNTNISEYLTFKGGTSLSKGYDAISRFSEDIDLTISRNAPFLRDGGNPLDDGISGNERKRRIEKLSLNAQKFIQDVTKPELHKDITYALGTDDGWNIEFDDSDPDGQTLLFHYPKAFNYGGGFGSGRYGVGSYGEGQTGYIKPQIKLEFGARGDIEPNEKRSIKPYAANIFPDEFEEPTYEVSMLGAERTFWEKATILHALYHNLKLRDRMSRHYYDTYMLDQKGIAEKALQAPDLLAHVVRNKSVMFKEPKASYETAIIGSLKLVPPKEHIDKLSDDYGKMQEMFMDEHPSFEEIIEKLTMLEEQINKAK